MIDSKQNLTFTLTHVESGYTFNVFPDTFFAEGTIRAYDEKIKELVKQKIISISESTAAVFGCRAELKLIDTYPPVINHLEQTSILTKVAEQTFGPSKVSQEDLPLAASEDYSHYLN